MKFVPLSKFLSTIPSPKGVVVTNAPPCAQIGGAILRKGGTAVDAAIAAMLSEGVAAPNTMGVGGGFIMTIYKKDTGVVHTLDSREVAPLAATEDMFGSDTNLCTRGGLSAAVPGELKGYWEVYQKHGGAVPWKDLLQPSIDLCKNGVPISTFVKRIAALDVEVLSNDEGLK